MDDKDRTHSQRLAGTLSLAEKLANLTSVDLGALGGQRPDVKVGGFADF